MALLAGVRGSVSGSKSGVANSSSICCLHAFVSALVGDGFERYWVKAEVAVVRSISGRKQNVNCLVDDVLANVTVVGG